MHAKNEVRVGIADYSIVFAPGSVITMGLGSCVGIAFYDRIKKVAGLVHIMLPDSTQFKNITNPMKYADLAVPTLLDKMMKLGCSKRNIVVKIAGGASMFNFTDKKIVSDIGKRNIEATKNIINLLGLTLISEDVGGDKGRTMIVEAENGTVKIRVVGAGIKEI